MEFMVDQRAIVTQLLAATEIGFPSKWKLNFVQSAQKIVSLSIECAAAFCNNFTIIVDIATLFLANWIQ